jgi:hypothetical protein
LESDASHLIAMEPCCCSGTWENLYLGYKFHLTRVRRVRFSDLALLYLTRALWAM